MRISGEMLPELGTPGVSRCWVSPRLVLIFGVLLLHCRCLHVIGADRSRLGEVSVTAACHAAYCLTLLPLQLNPLFTVPFFTSHAV